MAHGKGVVEPLRRHISETEGRVRLLVTSLFEIGEAVSRVPQKCIPVVFAEIEDFLDSFLEAGWAKLVDAAFRRFPGRGHGNVTPFTC